MKTTVAKCLFGKYSADTSGKVCTACEVGKYAAEGHWWSARAVPRDIAPSLEEHEPRAVPTGMSMVLITCWLWVLSVKSHMWYLCEGKYSDTVGASECTSCRKAWNAILLV